MRDQRIHNLLDGIRALFESIPEAPEGFRQVYCNQGMIQVGEVRRLLRASEGEEWQHAGRNICIVCGGQGFDEPEEKIR